MSAFWLEFQSGNLKSSLAIYPRDRVYLVQSVDEKQIKVMSDEISKICQRKEITTKTKQNQKLIKISLYSHPHVCFTPPS